MNPEMPTLPNAWKPLVSAETTAPAIRADLAKRAAPLITAEQMELIRSTVAKEATPDELKLYLFDCARQGVHPLDRLIHFTVRTNAKGVRRYTPITSIDFMRQRAAETGDCAGSDDAVFGDLEENRWPVSATVTVWRMVQGQRCPFTATARWSEYKPEKDDWMWRKMPHGQLGKCAEALALRKGFPKQLAGLYAKEEMDQAGPQDAPTVVRPTLSPPPDTFPRSGQAVPAIAAVSTGAPRSEGPPRREPPESDRPTPDPTTADTGGPYILDDESKRITRLVNAMASMPMPGVFIKDIRDGVRGASFEIILNTGESLLCYAGKLRGLAHDAMTRHVRVTLTRKTSVSGNVYISGLALAPGAADVVDGPVFEESGNAAF